jgi:ubiquinone/menaquinone biosynthesis C-methylase UbiE
MVSSQEVWREFDDVMASIGSVASWHKTLISFDQYRPSYHLARKYVPRNGRVLDWGAGNGHFSLFLLQSGLDAHAFSIDDAPYRSGLSEISRRYQNFRYKSGDPTTDNISLPYPDDYFDAVFSIGVLEHVREFGGDENASIKEIRRILRPGGVFICTHFPNAHSWVEFVARGHVFKYSRKDIRGLAERGQMALVETSRYQMLPYRLTNHLPAKLANNAMIAGTYSALDSALSTLLNIICTCHYFVMRKPRS